MPITLTFYSNIMRGKVNLSLWSYIMNTSLRDTVHARKLDCNSSNLTKHQIEF